MKCGKAAGTSLIVAEMLKASGVVGAQQIRDLIEDIIHFGKIPTKCPTKWEESIIIFLYKGKGVALEREKLSRPQFARSDHEGSRQGCWELPMTRSAHRWHAVWLHAWTQHHRCHIQCMPDTRKVPCRQQDIIHFLCQSGKGIRSCTQMYHLVGSSQAWPWGVAGVAHTVHVWKCQNQSACWL